MKNSAFPLTKIVIFGLFLTGTFNASAVTLLPPASLDDWTIVRNHSTLVVDLIEQDDLDWLRIQRVNSNGVAGGVYYTGPAGQLADLSGSVIMSGMTGTTQPRGVALRAPTLSAGVGYFLLINRDGAVGLALNAGTASGITSASPSVVAWSDPVQSFGGGPVILEFSAIGATIQGAVWQLNSEGQKTTVDPINSVFYDQATLLNPGYFGPYAGRYTSDHTTLFRQFQLAPIPEPAHYAVGLGVVTLMVVAFVRRRRSRAA